MAAVRVLGWIHAVLGGVGLAVGIWLCVGLMADPEGGPALQYVGPLFLAFGTLYFAPAFLGGVGLLRGAAWGRWLIIALSMLLLLAIPVGTLLGGFGLWALLRRQAPAPGEPEAEARPFIVVGPTIMPRPPGEARRRVLGLLMAMAVVGAGFVVALNAGFRAHEQTVPRELAAAFYPAVLILAAVVVYVVVKRPFAGWGAGAPPLNPFWLHRYRQKMRAEREAWEAARRLRIAVLSTDPGLRTYAERIEAGEAWSDEQIAYDRNPDALATCRHLAPVERALRQAGLEVRLRQPPQIAARCRIDETDLWAQFPPGRNLTYTERHLGGRSPQDDPEAYILCKACQATIDTVHPDLMRDDTPWFPRPAAGSAKMTGG